MENSGCVCSQKNQLDNGDHMDTWAIAWTMIFLKKS